MRHTQESVYTTISKKNKSGCPDDTEEVEAFENTWTYFELCEEEQVTLPELLYIMQKNLKWSDISARILRFILSGNLLEITVMD